ncbi:MAG TPA: hypothetical protein VFM88_12200 [Vicinamibacteria bacterium]|nr:hypothetical protein [Vicinamibacteria bacterium]
MDGRPGPRYRVRVEAALEGALTSLLLGGVGPAFGAVGLSTLALLAVS